MWNCHRWNLVSKTHLNSAVACTVVIALLFALSASIFIRHLGASVPTQLTDHRLGSTYFGSDIDERYQCLANRFSKTGVEYKHPLFPLLYFPLRLAQKLLGCDCRRAVVAALAVNAFFWALLCWLILFQITRRLLDTTVYSVLALSTASAVLWLPVPESYAFGGTSFLVPLAVLSVVRFRTNLGLHCVGFVTSGAITITNAMSSLVSLTLSLKPLKAIALVVIGGTLFLALSFLQLRICPSSYFFLAPQAIAKDYNQYAHFKPLGAYSKDFFLEPLLPGESVVCVVPKHFFSFKDGTYSFALS